MKRYWKLVTLSLLIGLSIGALYIHQVLAEESLPEFELVTLNGEGSVEEQIIIYGDYVENDWDYYASYKLTGDGINYLRDRSYFERLSESYYSPVINRFIKEDKGFMRGKDEQTNLFFENEESLAYVGPYIISENDYKFEVELLDRENGEVNSFTARIPDIEQLGYMYIMGVQLLGDKLSVMVYNHHLETQKVHIYEIDINEESVINEVEVAETEIAGYMDNLSPIDAVSPHDYWALEIGHAELDSDLGFEILDTELIAYHLETGKVIPVEEPEVNEDQSYHVSLGSDKIHFFMLSIDEIILQSYDLVEEKMSSAESIPFEGAVFEGLAGIYTYGDIIYILSNENRGDREQKKLYGIDLSEGKVSYEGEIQATDASQQSLLKKLHINDIRFK